MGQKILITDDEQLIRWTLEQHLTKEGCDLWTAVTAEKGLAPVNEDQPDLVLPEYLLPPIVLLFLRQ